MIFWLAKEEKNIIESILRALPSWFGIEDALLEYVKESYRLPVLAYKHNGEVVGFMTIKPTSDTTIEVYVIGILLAYHRQGIGASLLAEVKKYAKKEGFKFLQVKTLSPDVQDKDYLNSYAFYKAMGFNDVEVLPLWDEHNPCLMMIQSL